MNICLYYNAHPTGVSFYRLELPHSRLHTLYGEHVSFFSVEKIQEMTTDELRIIDVFIINRTWAAVLEAVEPVANILRQYGAKIILDMDDYWTLEPGHAFYDEYRKKNMSAIIERHLELADAVIASTKYLRDAILPFNSDVTICENIPHELYEQFKPAPTYSQHIRFGYFGAGQHLEDIKTIEAPLAKLAFDNSLDGKYRIYMAGYHPNNAVGHQYERIFSCDGKNENYCRIQSTDVYSYVGGYNFVDVALAPLKFNKFNSYKSELKIVEAAWMGKTIIASALPMYRDCIEHGVDGFLVQEKRPMDWFEFMRELILNPGMAAEMGAKLREKLIGKFNIDETTKRRYELYKRIKNDIYNKGAQ